MPSAKLKVEMLAQNGSVGGLQLYSLQDDAKAEDGTKVSCSELFLKLTPLTSRASANVYA